MEIGEVPAATFCCDRNLFIWFVRQLNAQEVQSTAVIVMRSNATNDVIVIGAGAAGLMAAIRAAERGKRTLLIEKNRRPGVKILMSGGTRCNITQNTDDRGIVAAYGASGKFLYAALAAFGVADTVQFFEEDGVATKIEDTGKIFPVSNKASDVLGALLGRLRRSTAELALAEPVLDLQRIDSRFQVVTSTRSIESSKIILCSGGKSYPGSGTTGDGYAWAAAMGHTIVPLRPALVPMRVVASWTADLRGITLPDVVVRVLEGESELVHRRGSLLFAHFGLSGPVVLDVSRVVSRHAIPNSLQLEIDFLPAISEPVLDDFLRNESIHSGKKLLAVVLAEHLPRRLADALLVQAGLSADRTAAALARQDRQRLSRLCKRLRLPIAGTLGFEKAEVTAGGVALSEVSSRDMQSKIVPGLYLAGEILDLDGPIGGYNFQAAWSTGWLAGNSV
jgi:predicted Rossmann fold flavoprotein